MMNEKHKGHRKATHKLNHSPNQSDYDGNSQDEEEKIDNFTMSMKPKESFDNLITPASRSKVIIVKSKL